MSFSKSSHSCESLLSPGLILMPINYLKNISELKMKGYSFHCIFSPKCYNQSIQISGSWASLGISILHLSQSTTFNHTQVIIPTLRINVIIPSKNLSSKGPANMANFLRPSHNINWNRDQRHPKRKSLHYILPCSQFYPYQRKLEGRYSLAVLKIRKLPP